MRRGALSGPVETNTRQGAGQWSSIPIPYNAQRAAPVAPRTRLDADGRRGRPGRHRRRARGQGRRLHREDLDRRERRLLLRQRRLRPDRDSRSRLRADEAAGLFPPEDDHGGDGTACGEGRRARSGRPVPGLSRQRRLRGGRDGDQDCPRLPPPHGRQGPVQDRQPQGLVPRRHGRDALAGRAATWGARNTSRPRRA